jgi:hypothetical protein
LGPGLALLAIGLVADAIDPPPPCEESDCWNIPASLVGFVAGVIWFAGALLGGIVASICAIRRRRAPDSPGTAA